MEPQGNIRIGKASTAMARLVNKLFDNAMLTLNTKTRVY